MTRFRVAAPCSLATIFLSICLCSVRAADAQQGIVFDGTPYRPFVNSYDGLLASADFDRDGFDDLALGEQARYGNGEGSFSRVSGEPFTIGARYYDLDGDGDLDRFRPSGNTVQVQRNLGLGFAFPSMAAASMLPAAAGATVAIDYDGDGLLDLATLISSTDQIAVIPNDGIGGYAAFYLVETINNPVNMLAGNFDGEGGDDLLITTSDATNNLHLFRNEGGGVFSPWLTRTAMNLAFTLEMADLDLDGDQDLAWTVPSLDLARYLFTTSADGPFGLAVAVGLPDDPVGLAPLDSDGDGDIDMAFSHGQGFGVSLAKNIGATPTPAGLVPAATRPVIIAAGDWNADGRDDVAWSAVATNYPGFPGFMLPAATTMFLGGAEEYAAGTPSFSFGPPESDSSLRSARMNGDQIPDVVVYRRWGALHEFLVAPGVGNGRVGAPVSKTLAGFLGTFVAGDFDGDGNGDVLGDYSSLQNGVKLGFFAGDGALGLADPVAVAALGTPRLLLADVTSHPGDDVLMPNPGTGETTLLSWDGVSTLEVRAVVASTVSAQDAAAGDVDGDDLPDIVVVGQQGQYFPQQPDGSFGEAVLLPLQFPARNVALGDLDGDGDLDIVYSVDGSGPGRSDVLINDGKGTFSVRPESSVATPGFPDEMRLVDVSGDGSPDLVAVAYRVDGAQVWLGDGEGGFGPLTIYQLGAYVTLGGIDDFNMDGAPDLLCADTIRDNGRIALNGVPQVAGATATGPNALRVEFTEPVRRGALDPANYAISGAGAGSLAASPSSVEYAEPPTLAGGAAVVLTWSAGEFATGDAVVEVASAVKDKNGNGVGFRRSATFAVAGSGAHGLVIE